MNATIWREIEDDLEALHRKYDRDDSLLDALEVRIKRAELAIAKRRRNTGDQP